MVSNTMAIFFSASRCCTRLTRHYAEGSGRLEDSVVLKAEAFDVEPVEPCQHAAVAVRFELS